MEQERRRFILLQGTALDSTISTSIRVLSGIMVSALDSGSSGPGPSPGQGTVLCSWARLFTLIVTGSLQPSV